MTLTDYHALSARKKSAAFARAWGLASPELRGRLEAATRIFTLRSAEMAVPVPPEFAELLALLPEKP